jgi:hypothetical protein
MAREYTLHRMPQRLEARCVFCAAAWTFGEGEVKGAQIDLPEHMRKNDDTKICPGSNYTVKLRYPAKMLDARDQEPAEDVPKDTDPFPFGCHKQAGHTYGQVPASWYDWFVGQEWSRRWPKVLAYIRSTQKALDKEMHE